MIYQNGLRLLAVTLLALPVLTACQTTSPPESSEILEADLVPRAVACQELRPFKIHSEDTVETIQAAVDADAAWSAFCEDLD